MTTPNHSGRFRRLSNTTDFRDKTFNGDMNETIKLPALNAVVKSVKYNDLSYATTRDLNKLRKEPEVMDDLQKGAAHNILMVVRKKYDQINKAREEKEERIDQLKVEKQKFQGERDLYAGEKGEGEKKVGKLQEGLKEVKVHAESSETEKKVMGNMIARLKADKVTYDQRKFNLEKELTFLRKQRQIIVLSNHGFHEEEDRTQKIYQKLLQHLEEENTERELHISNLNRMIEQKAGVNENTEIRQAEMKEIAENALQDKDGKEKNWQKVYLCHRFVEKVLRDKMNREMAKFNVVETAFKNIKTVTGVNNGDTLVKKFLNKEKAYGELLGKIAENERHILDLKAEMQGMSKETNKLRAESEVLNVNKKESKDLSKQEKQFHFMSQKSENCSLYAERLRSWLIKILRRYNHLDKKQAEELQNRQSLGDITDLFKQYLGQVSTTLEEAKDAEISDLTLESASNSSNIRVRLGEQPAQARQATLVDNDEEDFINNQRQDLLRNNERFMKEVRKKYEEEKKLKIESEPKKKQASPERPKPPPVENL